ncbi:MAG: PEP-CTERM sorting domain-containing protein [Planctomycetota bacterium]
MTKQTAVIAILAGTMSGIATAQPTELFVQQDYMSSGFFQSDYLRGEESGSSRATNRATSTEVFGVTGETAYFGFGFDPLAFSGPVEQAVFRVENVSTGFFPDVDPTNPAEISLHSLTADPLTAVDQDLAAGAGSWLDFRDTQITTASILSTTTVDGFGVFEWDITDLVNEWIANGDTNFAYTLGTSALLDPDGGAAVAFVNSSFGGLTGEEITARIAIVPAPGTIALLGLTGLVAGRRRR